MRILRKVSMVKVVWRQIYDLGKKYSKINWIYLQINPNDKSKIRDYNTDYVLIRYNKSVWRNKIEVVKD